MLTLIKTFIYSRRSFAISNFELRDISTLFQIVII